MPPLALSASIAATMPASISGCVRSWEVSGAMPPTVIVDDDEVPEAGDPAPVVVPDVDAELLQAVAVSAATPMAAANWIVWIRLLDTIMRIRLSDTIFCLS